MRKIYYLSTACLFCAICLLIIRTQTGPRVVVEDANSRDQVSDRDSSIGNVAEIEKKGKRKFEPSEIDRYLAKSGRNADALLAAFYLHESNDLLVEMEDHSSSKLACILLAARHPDAGKRLEFAIKLEALDPENGIGSVLHAAALMKQGNPPAAMEYLQSTSKGWKKIDPYLKQRELDYRGALQELGFSPLDAQLATRSRPELVHDYSEPLVKVVLESVKQAGKRGDDEAVEFAAVGLRVAKLVSSWGGLVGELEGHIIERSILKSLPDDTEYGETGMSVSDRLAQMRAEKGQILQLAQQAEPFLKNLPSEKLSQFYERWNEVGEKAAFAWLLEKEGVK